MNSNGMAGNFAMLAGMALAAAFRVNAATIYWDGGGEDDDWANTNNWNSQVKPVAGDTVFFGSVVLTNATAVIRQAETCGGLVLAGVAGSQARLTIADGGLTATGIDMASPGAGRAAEASIVQSNGTVNTINLVLGKYAWATGVYELVNGTLDVNNYLYVGNTGGDGSFVQRDGSAICKFLWLGYGDNGSGRYELHGGLLSATNSESLGLVGKGRGTFLQTGGTNLPVALTLGGVAGSTGEYQMCSGRLRVLAPGGTTIGNYGYGAFTQTGGTVTVENYLYIGFYASGEGRYALGGGELTFTNACYILVGHNGKGTLRLGETNGTGALVKGNAGVNFYVRNVETSDGTIEGWGSMPQLYLQNNGRVVADGYGTDRTLDLSTLATLSAKKATLSYSSTHGWFARNRGALRLKDIAAAANFCWGDIYTSFGQTLLNQPLVNSVKFACTGASGTLTGRLLAADHGGVLPGLDRVLSVWDFSGVTAAAATVTIRYDDLAAAAYGLSAGDLRVFQYDGAAWRNRTVSVDPATRTITASLLSPISQIAVAPVRSGSVLILK